VSFLQLISGKSSVLRPRLACEILPSGVVAARDEGAVGKSPNVAFAALPPGSVTPGLKTPNLPATPAVVAALEKALSDVGARERSLTVVIPDAAVRVLLLDFDSLPSRPQEALPIVRFRLRKLVPFEVENAVISYQVMQQTSSQVRAVVAIIPGDVLSEYEAAIRRAGYEPGVVLPSTIAAAAAIAPDRTALLVSHNGETLTTAITHQNELLLHRTLEMPPSPAQQTEELLQSVSVAMAYFEDTLTSRPETIYYVGPGNARELERLLADDSIHVRELVPAAVSGTADPSLLAGVTGALAS
jgi:type IV pilus assembly protein PilM